MENMLKADVSSIEEVHEVIKAMHEQISEIGVDSLSNETQCSKVIVDSLAYAVEELKNALAETLANKTTKREASKTIASDKVIIDQTFKFFSAFIMAPP